MNSVLRRINAPTRYGGLSLKAWAGLISAGVTIVLVITVFKTPFLPTLLVLSWCVVSPGLFLAMWAHQQGVSIPILIGDFARYSLNRRQRLITHTPTAQLRGGVVLGGTVPALTQQLPDAATWDDLDDEDL